MWAIAKYLCSSVITQERIVGLQTANKLAFSPQHFRLIRVCRLPKYLTANCNVSPRLSCGEITLDRGLVWASEVGDRIGHVAADIDFPIRPCDLIDDLQANSLIQYTINRLLEEVLIHFSEMENLFVSTAYVVADH